MIDLAELRWDNNPNGSLGTKAIDPVNEVEYGLRMSLDENWNPTMLVVQFCKGKVESVVASEGEINESLGQLFGSKKLLDDYLKAFQYAFGYYTLKVYNDKGIIATDEIPVYKNGVTIYLFEVLQRISKYTDTSIIDLEGLKVEDSVRKAVYSTGVCMDIDMKLRVG